MTAFSTTIDDLRLIGDGVVLRRMRREDAENVVRWRSQPHVADQLFSRPPTIEEHRRWFDAVRVSSDRQEFIICTGLAATEVPIGTIGLSGIDRHHERAEYGIVIGETSALGKGVAAEASLLLLVYAFQTLGLHRVFLQVFRDNARARRLYERLGFVEEGILRQHAVRGDAHIDVVVMGLLREEWLRSRS